MAAYWLSRWHTRLAETVLVYGLVLVFLVVGDGSLLSQLVYRCWLLLQRVARHGEVVAGFVAPAVACGLGIHGNLPDEARHSWHISQAASSILCSPSSSGLLRT